MKTTYKRPETRVYPIIVGQLIAASLLERDEGSGGNVAETKEMVFDFSEDDY